MAGGHSNHFQLVPELGDSLLLKKTNNHEITSYERIFHSAEDDPRQEENLLFQKFLPMYYGYMTDVATGETMIKLENLLHNR